mgnify:CR=1 FL=1
MKRFFNWLADKISPEKAPPRVDVTQTGQHTSVKKTGKPRKQAVPRSQPEYIDFDSSVDGQIETGGPGKNILRKSKFVRDDSGRHDSLSILDESVADAEQDGEGIDPYNTGQFDRSKNWDKRFRKD